MFLFLNIYLFYIKVMYNNSINKLPTKTMPEELQKWIDAMPKDCGYELASFKRGEYYGEKQIKLFLRRK